MCRKPDYRLHTACYIALFTVGNAIITFPKSGGGTVAGFTSVSGLAVAAYILSSAVCRSAEKSGARFKKGFSVPLLFFVAAISVYCFFDCFIDFCAFADIMLLPENPNFAIAALLVFTVTLLSVKPSSVTMKLSLLFAAFFALSVPISVLLTAGDFSAAGINIGGFRDIKNGIIGSCGSVILPALLIRPYLLIANKNAPEASGTFGLIFGLATVALCVLDSLFLFGSQLAEKLPFPLATAVSTVTVGSLFTRMDGLVYFLFFMSALMKTVFCARLCIAALKKIRKFT